VPTVPQLAQSASVNEKPIVGYTVSVCNLICCRIQYQEKIVEVPQVQVQERIVHVPVTIIQEREIHIPRIETLAEFKYTFYTFKGIFVHEKKGI
jgi:hypothetical protein